MFGPEESARLKISPQVSALFSLISDISEYANFSDTILDYSRIYPSVMSEKKRIIYERMVKTADAER